MAGLASGIVSGFQGGLELGRSILKPAQDKRLQDAKDAEDSAKSEREDTRLRQQETRLQHQDNEGALKDLASQVTEHQKATAQLSLGAYDSQDPQMLEAARQSRDSLQALQKQVSDQRLKTYGTGVSDLFPAAQSGAEKLRNSTNIGDLNPKELGAYVLAATNQTPKQALSPEVLDAARRAQDPKATAEQLMGDPKLVNALMPEFNSGVGSIDAQGNEILSKKFHRALPYQVGDHSSAGHAMVAMDVEKRRPNGETFTEIAPLTDRGSSEADDKMTPVPLDALGIMRHRAEVLLEASQNPKAAKSLGEEDDAPYNEARTWALQNGASWKDMEDQYQTIAAGQGSVLSVNKKTNEVKKIYQGPQAIPSGGLLMPDGKVISPAAKPGKAGKGSSARGVQSLWEGSDGGTYRFDNRTGELSDMDGEPAAANVSPTRKLGGSEVTRVTVNKDGTTTTTETTPHAKGKGPVTAEPFDIDTFLKKYSGEAK